MNSDFSLIVKHKDVEVFKSRGKWLYPLFDLEEFIKERGYSASELYLIEKVAGQAAAFLIVRLGIKQCHVKLISEKAIEVFGRFNVLFTYDEKVPMIQCKTEHILASNFSLEEAWQLLRRRAGKVHGVNLTIEKLEVDIKGQPIIDGLDLILKHGEGLIIGGQNGVGKTTLLKSILGLQPINSGIIKIGDFQVGSQVWKKNRHITGYVHQEQIKSLLPISAAEVVEIGLAARKFSGDVINKKVRAAMERTGSAYLAARNFEKLSGGEKQRISLARCICQQARLFLFDEPTTFLDHKSRDELFELLTEFWQNEAPTMIIVSHDDSWISRFDWEVKELSRGKLC